MEKLCSQCGILKPAVEFGPDKRATSGLRPECKECRKTYYRANKTSIIAKATDWARRNRGKVKANHLAWRRAHPEEIRVRDLAWKAANPEKARSVARASETRWRANHPVAAAAKDQRSRDRRDQCDAHITDEEMHATLQEAFDQSLGICTYCLKPFDNTHTGRATVDHIIPRSLGGPTVSGNVVIVCGRCNSKKGNRGIFGVIGPRPLLLVALLGPEIEAIPT